MFTDVSNSLLDYRALSFIKPKGSMLELFTLCDLQPSRRRNSRYARQ